MNTGPSMWQILSPIQSTLAAILGAIPQILQQGGVPTTLPGWGAAIFSAIVSVCALHVTAPRHQDQATK
jgi:hypothetical protein